MAFSARCLAIAIAMLAIDPGRAEAQTEQDFAIWGALFFTGQVYADSPSPTFWLDVHGRQDDSGTVAIFRPGVGLAFSPWGSLWLGYAWVPVWPSDVGERLDEQRIWEQLLLTFRGDRGVLFQSRTRVEQRFLKGASGTAHRFRQFVRLNYKPRQRLPVGLAIWDEVFVGMQGATWAQQGFDQNRVFAGIAIYAFQKLFRVEVGYLNVYVNRQTNQMAHVLSMNFFVSFKGRQYKR
ncbi:MAG: DUF2490 domain-containing protein [Myxococcota bacterium]